MMFVIPRVRLTYKLDLSGSPGYDAQHIARRRHHRRTDGHAHRGGLFRRAIGQSLHVLPATIASFAGPANLCGYP